MLNMLPSRVFPFMTDYQLSAIPLFIFMAAILEKAGLIEELFDAVYKWLGGLKGGLASATVIVCTILAAIVASQPVTELGLRGGARSGSYQGRNTTTAATIEPASAVSGGRIGR